MFLRLRGNNNFATRTHATTIQTAYLSIGIDDECFATLSLVAYATSLVDVIGSRLVFNKWNRVGIQNFSTDADRVVTFRNDDLVAIP